MPFVIYDNTTKEIQTVWNIGLVSSASPPSGSTAVDVQMNEISLVLSKGANEKAFYDTDLQQVYLADARTLDELKDDRLSALEADTKSFIEYVSPSVKRYTQEKQASFNSIFQVNKLIIGDSEATQGEKDAAQAIIDKLLQVFAWIKSVLDYHFEVNSEILEAEDAEDLALISWDFDDFNETDPDISLQEVV